VLRVRDGEIAFFPGDYDYYLDKSARDAVVFDGVISPGPDHLTSQSNSSQDGKERKRQEAEERQARYQLRQEFRTRLSELEQRIVALERRQNELVSTLESRNGGDSQAATSLELKQVTDELAVLLPEWERLAERSARYQ
jgi:hypothetical protein